MRPEELGAPLTDAYLAPGSWTVDLPDDGLSVGEDPDNVWCAA